MMLKIEYSDWKGSEKVLYLQAKTTESKKSMSEEKPYIVSARKYRPATFKTVVGQRALTSTLKNAIESHRLAQAYLFCGPRGVGKTSCARIFAKTINCQNLTADGEACGQCESCRAIEQGTSFNLVELDAASNNSVDDIRSITEQVNVPPQNGNYRIFIIDEVHMLSNAAFNAFLKTLEEPPKNVVFILATTEKHKVIPTILSRCQIYDFKRITVDDMIDHLEYVAKEEGITTEREALGVIALKADGAMRDALSIFDQVAASSMGDVTYEKTIDNLNVLDYDYYFRLVDAFREGDVPSALLVYKQIRDKGFDSLFLVNGLAAHVRDLLVAVDERTVTLLETSEGVARRYAEQAKTLPVEWYYAAMRLLSECDLNYRTATSKRLLVEITLIRLCQLLKPASPPFDSLDRRMPLGDPVAERRPSPSVESVVSQQPTSPQQPVVQQQPMHQSTSPQQPTDYQQYMPPQQSISPQPAPVQPMAPQPSVPQTSPNQAPAAGRPRVAPRPSTLRLNAQRQSSSPQASGLVRRNKPINHDVFMEAWGSFAASNPSLHILVNAMRASHPVPADQHTYRIVVDHPAQQQSFELSMGRLLEYLRDRLENDYLSLKVEVTTEPVGAKQLPPREYLKQVVSSNPALAGFLNAIEGELV